MCYKIIKKAVDNFGDSSLCMNHTEPDMRFLTLYQHETQF